MASRPLVVRLNRVLVHGRPPVLSIDRSPRSRMVPDVPVGRATVGTTVWRTGLGSRISSPSLFMPVSPRRGWRIPQRTAFLLPGTARVRVPLKNAIAQSGDFGPGQRGPDAVSVTTWAGLVAFVGHNQGAPARAAQATTEGAFVHLVRVPEVRPHG